DRSNTNSRPRKYSSMSKSPQRFFKSSYDISSMFFMLSSSIEWDILIGVLNSFKTSSEIIFYNFLDCIDVLTGYFTFINKRQVIVKWRTMHVFTFKNKSVASAVTPALCMILVSFHRLNGSVAQQNSISSIILGPILK